MADTVLLVDDEEYVLNSIERLLACHDGIRVFRAASGADALKLIEEESVAVIVSDNMMPGMKGTELLSRVKTVSPDTVRILLTAYADFPTAIEAINSGEVFRFIVKPWDDGLLVRTVQEAAGRHHLIRSLRVKDKAILLSLAQTIELKDPYTRGHCERVAGYALMIAEALDLPEASKKDIEYGSWLHDCGKVGIPERILNNKCRIDEEDFEVVKRHPLWGADVARQAQLSEVIVNIILYHHEKFNGKGYPSAIMGEQIPVEARIVAVADVFDALTTDRPYRAGLSKEEAVEIISSLKGESLDPDIVNVFLSELNRRSDEGRRVAEAGLHEER
ncbi:MAG: response regulator [Nitrospirae bacterium]|nr:response regulator [Nitrospirota bacterium]